MIRTVAVNLALALALATGLIAAALPAQVWRSDQGDGTYRNPVLFDDYPDPVIIRVGEDFYFVLPQKRDPVAGRQAHWDHGGSHAAGMTVQRGIAAVPPLERQGDRVAPHCRMATDEVGDNGLADMRNISPGVYATIYRAGIAHPPLSIPWGPRHASTLSETPVQIAADASKMDSEGDSMKPMSKLETRKNRVRGGWLTRRRVIPMLSGAVGRAFGSFPGSFWAI